MYTVYGHILMVSYVGLCTVPSDRYGHTVDSHVTGTAHPSRTVQSCQQWANAWATTSSDCIPGVYTRQHESLPSASSGNLPMSIRTLMLPPARFIYLFFFFFPPPPDPPTFRAVLPGFSFGPYGRGQTIDHHRSGTFAWISALLHGPPGRPATPNAPPFSPNYVHVADVARAHVAALRVGPLDPPRRKRVLLVAGFVLWPEVIAHLARALPEIRERLPSPACGPGPMAYARFEARNAS
jgi:hypothetical protein